MEAAHDIKAAVARRSGVIGMTFQVRGQIENVAALERMAGELIQSVKDAKANGRAAAKPTG